MVKYGKGSQWVFELQERTRDIEIFLLKWKLVKCYVVNDNYNKNTASDQIRDSDHKNFHIMVSFTTTTSMTTTAIKSTTETESVSTRISLMAIKLSTEPTGNKLHVN